ncbi:endolytic transglycosylase MltG [Cohnella silvisoli]|uniref:Endolytic murein transglycosylase n=1 Tax=Cohnella silvisoli TaxID=2873699 RepID=A0ABV1KVQ9_9BACL|nr:endolytic transglycosylase MltG [Cohnella silvisoli]MCD9023086.1 endolytic transglycosylase MltG [Cohnella silvisoli]
MDRDDGPVSNGWKSIYGNKVSGDEDKPTDVSETAAATETNKTSYPSRVAASNRSAASSVPSAQAPQSETARTTAVPVVGRRKPRVLLWSFLIALGLVLSMVAGVLFYLWNGLRPTSTSATPVQITISSGMRAKKVAEVLEQNGLIRSAFLFSGWLKLQGEGSRFQAGVYELTPGMTRDQIVAKLNNGEIMAAATIHFTIPEGFTVQQIAARLAETAGVNKAKFLEAAGQPAQWTGSMWTKTLPTDNNLRFPLEGYLFPETYEMKRGSTEADIINRMLSELDHKLDQLPEDWQSTLEERGLTVHQLLTIASLVEREVVVDDERPIVASVIQNRLKKKMPLQIDATIQYLLDKQKERLLEVDLKVDSPYNTYLRAGLPPGPIASPSFKSIEAALFPEQTDYLYYVTKKDGTNTHLFAVTYKQHQKNIQLSEKNVKK